MPTSAVSRPRNSPVPAAASRVAVATPPPPPPSSSSSTGRSARPRAGSTVGGESAGSSGGGGQQDGTKSRAATSRGTERGRLGRVLHQQVRADIHAGPSAVQQHHQQQHQQQQQAGRPSRSTPPATEPRRSGLPRSSTAADSGSGKCRARSSDVVGRQDNDRAALPRLSASSSTGNAEKSEEELEKMRILARHIKVRRRCQDNNSRSTGSICCCGFIVDLL